MPTRRDRLFDILSIMRPHDGANEHAFCAELDKIPCMRRDAFGNRMIDIPRADYSYSSVLWSCHVDTVAARDGVNKLSYDDQTGIVALARGKAGQSLGADDGVGVWIMLEMIYARVEGLYIFHRGEEHGCLGSRWIAANTPEMLSKIRFAIAFDRAGTDEIITHQSSGMTASDAFAYSLASQLNAHNRAFGYAPSDRGVYTDTNEYAALVCECTNVAVGYEDQHGPRETLDVHHCEALLDAVLEIDIDALVCARRAGDKGYKDYSPWGDYDTSLEQLCAAYPATAARILDALGATDDDFYAEIGNA